MALPEVGPDEGQWLSDRHQTTFYSGCPTNSFQNLKQFINQLSRGVGGLAVLADRSTITVVNGCVTSKKERCSEAADQ